MMNWRELRGKRIRSTYNTSWVGHSKRIWGDGQRILVDVEVIECLDKRGIGRMLTIPLRDLKLDENC